MVDTFIYTTEIIRRNEIQQEKKCIKFWKYQEDLNLDSKSTQLSRSEN